MNATKPDTLNDSLDDLIGGASGAVRSEPVRGPADYIPGTGGRPNKFKDVKEYTEPCRKCRGTGRYTAPSTHGSRCFECDGVGTKTFRTSPETRSKAKAGAHARKAKRAADERTARQEAGVVWRAAHKAEADWIDAKAPTFGFAASMQQVIIAWGSLTAGQLLGIQNCMANEKERVQQNAERAKAAPVADQAGVDRLKKAFDDAIEYTRAKGKGRKLSMPRITIGSMVISPAKAESSNPGALYVKSGGEYLGKVKDGRFWGVRGCTEAQEKQILAFIADPKAAAKAYGIETGTCCICNATLTNKESIEGGIGPICATKFGW